LRRLKNIVLSPNQLCDGIISGLRGLRSVRVAFGENGGSTDPNAVAGRLRNRPQS
jgi:hypothetical protein